MGKRASVGVWEEDVSGLWMCVRMLLYSRGSHQDNRVPCTACEAIPLNSIRRCVHIAESRVSMRIGFHCTPTDSKDSLRCATR